MDESERVAYNLQYRFIDLTAEDTSHGRFDAPI